MAPGNFFAWISACRTLPILPSRSLESPTSSGFAVGSCCAQATETERDAETTRRTSNRRMCSSRAEGARDAIDLREKEREGLLGRRARPTLVHRQVALLVLLAAPARAGIVPSDARAGAGDLPGRRRRGALRIRSVAVRLGGAGGASLRQRRKRSAPSSLRGPLRLRRGLRGRRGLRLHRLDAHDDRDGRGGDAPLHDLEELEPFLLVLDLRILLAIPAQVDALA